MADFFLLVIMKICQSVIFQNIKIYDLIKPLQSILRHAQNQEIMGFYQISENSDKIKCPYFFDLMHI